MKISHRARRKRRDIHLNETLWSVAEIVRNNQISAMMIVCNVGRMRRTCYVIERSYVRYYSAKKSFWREAATVILTAPESNLVEGSSTGPSTGEADTNFTQRNSPFHVLKLKRGEGSAFLPNRFVYPGGVVSLSDFADDWLSLFHGISGISCKHLGIERDFRLNDGSRPPGMRQMDNTKMSNLPAEIGFRIAAIRETFEECGILLAIPEQSFSTLRETGGHLMDHTSSVRHQLDIAKAIPLPDKEMSHWRDKVASDASAFLDLCKEFRVAPNIWSLYEWSNWLTPAVRQVEGPTERPRRFDTMFFACCLPEKPQKVEADSGETTAAKVRETVWWCPFVWWTLIYWCIFTNGLFLFMFCLLRLADKLVDVCIHVFSPCLLPSALCLGLSF